MFIYVIVNSETLKIYIGQHKGNNLRKYLQDKLSAAKIGQNQRSHLFASMRKYPKEVWRIYPLISDLHTRAECDYWETVLIKSLNTQHDAVGYNICRGGEGRTGPYPEDARARQRGIPKPNGFGEKIRQALTGREWTAEQREKIPVGIKKSIREGRMKIHQFTSDELDRAHRAAAEKFTGVPRPIEHTAGMHTPEAQAKAHRNSGLARRGRKVGPNAAKKAWDTKFLKTVAYG